MPHAAINCCVCPTAIHLVLMHLWGRMLDVAVAPAGTPLRVPARKASEYRATRRGQQLRGKPVIEPFDVSEGFLVQQGSNEACFEKHPGLTKGHVNVLVPALPCEISSPPFPKTFEMTLTLYAGSVSSTPTPARTLSCAVVLRLLGSISRPLCLHIDVPAKSPGKRRNLHGILHHVSMLRARRELRAESASHGGGGRHPEAGTRSRWDLNSDRSSIAYCQPRRLSNEAPHPATHAVVHDRSPRGFPLSGMPDDAGHDPGLRAQRENGGRNKPAAWPKESQRRNN